jgi:hypothetical protein
MDLLTTVEQAPPGAMAVKDIVYVPGLINWIVGFKVFELLMLYELVFGEHPAVSTYETPQE